MWVKTLVNLIEMKMVFVCVLNNDDDCERDYWLAKRLGLRIHVWRWNWKMELWECLCGEWETNYGVIALSCNSLKDTNFGG